MPGGALAHLPFLVYLYLDKGPGRLGNGWEIWGYSTLLLFITLWPLGAMGGPSTFLLRITLWPLEAFGSPQL